ncbi:isopentenyl-diphosphate Delta-isomerase [soil metagenome]
MTTTELVVLVDEDGTPTGTADKTAVHSAETPLHLAFSCHVYNAEGQVLVTRRALGKLTWPGVWTNSFCGHPAPGETMGDAIARRAAFELGLRVAEVAVVLPDFRYRAVDASGIVENELCPVYRAVAVGGVTANPDEVAEYAWVSPESLHAAAIAAPYAFSSWLGWQLEQLAALERGAAGARPR